MIDLLKSSFLSLLDLLMPRMCAACGCKLAVSEEDICVKCLMDLPRTMFHVSEVNPLEQMYWGRIPIVGATALMYYKEGFKGILMKMKYKGMYAIAEHFGRLMAEELIAESDFLNGIDMIVPVPLHWRRKLKRGYNQSLEIARGIAQVSGLPICTDAVRRHKDNKSQTQLTHAERQQNVEDIFRCTRPERLKGRHILLVDDVITTGATTLSCATEIMRATGMPLPYDGRSSHDESRTDNNIQANNNDNIQADNNDDIQADRNASPKEGLRFSILSLAYAANAVT